MIFGADSFGPQDGPGLKAHHYDVILRYVSFVNALTKPKIITKPEFEGYKAAGLHPILNYEWHETRCQQGFSAGAEDGQITLDKMKEIGYPATDPCYFSDDTGGTTINQLIAYFGGVASKLPTSRIGYYGGQGKGLQLMDLGKITKLWVANAASWSGYNSWQQLRANLSPRAHIFQHLNADQPLGWNNSIDHNDIPRADYAGGKEVAFDLTNPVDKEAFEDIQRIHNALFNPGAAPHSLLLDILGQPASVDIQKLADALAPKLTPADAKALADELARRLQA